uniref:hypothetical protein n=1 Tax=Pararhizobium sp. IMCC3301 TaxID=3067904 RepID=UPI0027415B06|nr:hypothetical protein [Pararhizobium sp. IMCC3301]
MQTKSRHPLWRYAAAFGFTVSALVVTSAEAERFQMIELNQTGNSAYLRIDLESGSVSRCEQENAVWQCSAITDMSAEQETSLKRRIDELERRVDRLEAEQTDQPDMAKLEEALDMSEQVMRRFFSMVQDIKKDMAE